MNRSTLGWGLLIGALCFGMTGCKKKRDADDMPPVAAHKKGGKGKGGKGDSGEKQPPTVFDFEKEARAEITTENAADRLLALEREIYADQEQLKALPGAKSKDSGPAKDGADSKDGDSEPEPMPSPSGAKAGRAKAPPKLAAPKAASN